MKKNPALIVYDWSTRTSISRSVQALCHDDVPSQRQVTRRFDVFFVLCLNKRLNNQSGRRWFETPPCSLWRRCNDTIQGLLIYQSSVLYFTSRYCIILIILSFFSASCKTFSSLNQNYVIQKSWVCRNTYYTFWEYFINAYTHETRWFYLQVILYPHIEFVKPLLVWMKQYLFVD